MQNPAPTLAAHDAAEPPNLLTYGFGPNGDISLSQEQVKQDLALEGKIIVTLSTNPLFVACRALMNREGKNAGERYQTLQGIIPDPDLLERLGDLGDRATDPLGMNAVAANIDAGTGRVASPLNLNHCRNFESRTSYVFPQKLLKGHPKKDPKLDCDLGGANELGMM